VRKTYSLRPALGRSELLPPIGGSRFGAAAPFTETTEVPLQRAAK
jgi:hypothetical protein